MSNLSENEGLEIAIPEIEILDKVTHYKISVQLGNYSWRVTHRYSEFADLHDLLVSHHGLASDLLPPKKIIGNKDPSFIEKRRKDLELYLQTVVSFMSVAIPEQLSEFLELKYYEINFLLQDMARFFYSEGEQILQDNKFIEFNPLQLLAISKQMQSSNPIGFDHHKESDFANIADFCSDVKRIIVKGSSRLYRSSNLKMNDLQFNLTVFKNVEEFNIVDVALNKIEKLGPVRKSVKSLRVHNSEICTLSEILVCDSLYKEIEENNNQYTWSNLENLDLSFNSIEVIDNSVVLTPNLRFLNLKGNKLKNIGNFLVNLPKLVHLDLSKNYLIELNDLHTKLGNIITLNLSNNFLTSLDGFGKLYSVTFLNLSSNKICTVSQVEPVCRLPCLEELNLMGNPITTIIDYRIKILEMFGKRACEISLDNERATQKELDKVAVLLALKQAREGRLPSLTLSHPLPSTSFNVLLEKPDVGTIAKE